jgi:adenylosuccinate lyase
MSNDLVKRLRQIGEGAYVGAVSDDRKAAKEAADRIEKLEAALQKIADITKTRHHKIIADINLIARKALEGKDE